ncbi:hypothetical protein ACSFA3_20895 [Variovorax sp. RHLX14]|uniref:hypothetical protein n=1 Tax=Variovorax sp. RHLX14 TaxID=1259731 RepID=UPI003F48EECA
MHSTLDAEYHLDDDLLKLLADASKAEDEFGPPLSNLSTVDKLLTENSRLDDDTTKVFPESPWYLVIVTVVVVGSLVGTLILLW